MPSPQFAHRDNPDGSRDSICLKCFRTVTNNQQTNSEKELEAMEAEHVCETHTFDVFKLVINELKRG